MLVSFVVLFHVNKWIEMVLFELRGKQEQQHHLIVMRKTWCDMTNRGDWGLLWHGVDCYEIFLSTKFMWNWLKSEVKEDVYGVVQCDFQQASLFLIKQITWITWIIMDPVSQLTYFSYRATCSQSLVSILQCQLYNVAYSDMPPSICYPFRLNVCK